MFPFMFDYLLWCISLGGKVGEYESQVKNKKKYINLFFYQNWSYLDSYMYRITGTS